MILPRNLVVMVVDGARMVLMRNQGDATDPQLTVIAHREWPLLRDLGCGPSAALRMASASASVRPLPRVWTCFAPRTFTPIAGLNGICLWTVASPRTILTAGKLRGDNYDGRLSGNYDGR